MPSGVRVAQRAQITVGGSRSADAVAAQQVEVDVFEREPGDVLISNVVLTLLGRQGPQPPDGGV
jgi:hypothetical protein